MPPDGEPEPDPAEDGGETCVAEVTEGELAVPEPDEEEYELAGDVPAEDYEADYAGLLAPEDAEPVTEPFTEWDEAEFPPLAGIMPAPDWEPEAPEDAAP